VIQEKISVLVCDDSALMRNLISKMIEADPELTVAGTAMNGRFALDKLQTLNPDVIVLDLEMPEMNGIEFLKERKARGLKIPVVILSSMAQKGARITMEALALDAEDFILKPSSGSSDIGNVQEQLNNLVKAYGRKYKQSGASAAPAGKKPARTSPTAPAASRESIPAAETGTAARKAAAPAGASAPRPARKPLTRQVEVVALGISTGGPNALREVFPKLDPGLPVPVLVVQHMPAGFTKEFAASLDRICPLEVKEAEDGDLLKPGRVLIAPGDSHIEVEQRKLATVIRLSQAPLRSGHRPSADFLFESVGKTFGGRALAVIMTGMGKDGATEIGRIYQEGGLTVAQDQESCVVFGMPRVAIENGFIDHVVPLEQMADTINRLVNDNN